MAPTRVLFLCVGNTCRSPMAEAIARAVGAGDIEAASAGIAPTGRISPVSRAALRQLGYDDTGLSSKGLDALPLADADVIVSLIGAEGLRLLPPGLRARRIAWSVPDPFGEEAAVHVAVARRIEKAVTALVRELRRADGVSPGAP